MEWTSKNYLSLAGCWCQVQMELNQKTEQPFHQLWDFLEEKWDINKYEFRTDESTCKSQNQL